MVGDAVATGVPSDGFETTAERARLIVELRRAGWTYVALGDLLGLSRQRVAQIDHTWRRRFRLGTGIAGARKLPERTDT